MRRRKLFGVSLGALLLALCVLLPRVIRAQYDYATGLTYFRLLASATSPGQTMPQARAQAVANGTHGDMVARSEHQGRIRATLYALGTFLPIATLLVLLLMHGFSVLSRDERVLIGGLALICGWIGSTTHVVLLGELPFGTALGAQAIIWGVVAVVALLCALGVGALRDRLLSNAGTEA